MKRKYIPAKIRRKVFERDNFTCVYCGVRAYEEPLEIDHVIPISKGGTNNINNLVTSCRRCNRMKHDSLPVKKEIVKAFTAILPPKKGQDGTIGYAYWGGVLDSAIKLANSDKLQEIKLVTPLLKLAYEALIKAIEQSNSEADTIRDDRGVSAYNGHNSSYNGNSLTVATA